MKNPVLTRDLEKIDGESATIQGIALLTLFDLLFVLVGAMASWTQATVFMPWIIPLTFGTLAIGFYTCYHPKLAMYLGPTYAVVEGSLIGVYSYILEQQYTGIVMEAVACTFGIALACNLLYGTGFITISSGFKRAVYILTAGIAFTYLIDFCMYLFLGKGFPLLHENTWQGIAVSFIICCIAVARLLVDYDEISIAVQKHVSVEYEAYYAFGLTVTLIWLYLEILRLMGKSRGRKK